MVAFTSRVSLAFAPSSLIAIVLAAGVVACAAGGSSNDATESSNPLRTSGPLGARDAVDCSLTAPDAVPDDLRCTGLYSDWSTRTIDPRNAPFTPGFELWSDGAKKSRFIYLPPGSKIDARNMNQWVFPVGTKIWKEFRLKTTTSTASELTLIETRMAHKTAADRWSLATYVWSPEQDNAKHVTTGIMPFPGTTSYEVPAERTCNRCHANRNDRILGFEAVLLAAPEAKGLTYDRLLAQGLLETGEPKPPPASVLQIPGNAVERDALGRLHANCGISCHNPEGAAPFSMRIDTIGGRAPGSIVDTSVFQEAVGQDSFFTPANGVGNYYRIRPTDEEGSTIFYRMSKRDAPSGREQMPPVATHITDPALLGSIGAWIRSMTDAPYPGPGPR